MSYLECIRIKTGGDASSQAPRRLWEEVRRELDSLEPGHGQIVARMDQPGEVMVLLHWPSEDDARGSAVAQALVQELRSHGLVSFSAWGDPAPLDPAD